LVVGLSAGRVAQHLVGLLNVQEGPAVAVLAVAVGMQLFDLLAVG
jgi:hypothetical protein